MDYTSSLHFFAHHTSRKAQSTVLYCTAQCAVKPILSERSCSNGRVGDVSSGLQTVSVRAHDEGLSTFLQLPITIFQERSHTCQYSDFPNRETLPMD